jgi:4,5-dihydroxyphthalate decarboxylase
MADLQLSFAAAPNERTSPLLDGTVRPEGIDLIGTRSDPSETFWRQLRFQEFAVTEMSLSSYLIAKERGMDMIAIPVFPSRRFPYTQLWTHVAAGIERPGDLAGKRIGIGEYQQTAAVWTRATLQHDFGVSQYDVHWYMERSEDLSHGGATGFVPPERISFQRIPAEKSLASMLLANEIDAAPLHRALGAATNVIDRSTRIRGDGDLTKVKPLFADAVAEGARFYREHGYVPASHTVIVRGDVHRDHPWVAFNLYMAFVRAKELARARLAESIPTALVFGREYLARTRELLGDDPFPYGVQRNRKMLEDLTGHSVEQGLTQAKVAVEDLFAPSTLDL